jgi:hypothetical protein
MTATVTATGAREPAVALRRQTHRFTSLLRARALQYAAEHPTVVDRTGDWPEREGGDQPWRDLTVAEFIRIHRAPLYELLDDSYGHGATVRPVEEHLRSLTTVEEIWALRDMVVDLCAELGGGPEWWREVRVSP